MHMALNLPLNYSGNLSHYLPTGFDCKFLLIDVLFYKHFTVFPIMQLFSSVSFVMCRVGCKDLMVFHRLLCETEKRNEVTECKE